MAQSSPTSSPRIEVSDHHTTLIHANQNTRAALQSEVAMTEESKLARKEHWDATFQMELQNFERHGDDGEVWFGKDVQKKTIQYIMENYCSDTERYPQLNLLDVGTGNGALLFKLAKKGISRMFESVFLKGIDYSSHSIMFAQRIQERFLANEAIQNAQLKEDYRRLVFEY